jgi:2-polyprenyl-3-methyl-5-hydroxy-6-metoxy-1,4-benzoquinol methylase
MDWRADFRCGPAEAPHTGDYLWGHIISLCAALRVRRVADIGCGNGALCRELVDRGYEVVACEPNAGNLHFAQLGAPGLVFHRLRVDDDPSVIGNQSFDVAIATEVIEHLVRPFNLPHFAKQLLRPGGHLIISTPYHRYLKNLVLSLRTSGTHTSVLSGMAVTLSSGRTRHCPNC